MKISFKINDDLNGVERPVSFPINALDGKRAEVVHSLAKWKRMKFAAHLLASRDFQYKKY